MYVSCKTLGTLKCLKNNLEPSSEGNDIVDGQRWKIVFFFCIWRRFALTSLPKNFQRHFSHVEEIFFSRVIRIFSCNTVITPRRTKKGLESHVFAGNIRESLKFNIDYINATKFF